MYKKCVISIKNLPKISEVTQGRAVILSLLWWVGGTTGSASDQQATNDRKIAGSRPTKVVCITVLTGNRLGWTARCGWPSLLPSCRKLEFRLSALMDSDLAWVNGKSGRQSWRYADASQRSIILEAIYHLLVCMHDKSKSCVQIWIKFSEKFILGLLRNDERTQLLTPR